MEMNDISNLASLLRENGDKVLNGQSKLTLTAKLLKNINEAFSMIVEEEEARSTSFHASNLKVEVFHEIQFLHDFVQKTIGLKVTSGSVTCDNFQGSLDISRFKNLRYLELRKVPVSFLSGVKSVRHQLQSIVCIRCIQRLQELLLDCGADHTSGSVWSDLKEAVFSYNGMNVLDHSLDYTPLLQILDLSHNRIAHAEALECLPNLKYLNISYNLLEAVPTVHREACRKLQVLVIRNNYIEDLSGLSALENILELDLSCNCLSDHTSLSPLIYLSSLTWLSLDGNPLSFHPQHRIRTVRNLHTSAATAKFLLDRLPLSKSERLAAGSSSAASSIRSFSRDDSSSAGSSTASEKTLLAEKGVECKMKPQSKVIRKRVREAIISEGDDNLEDSFLSSSISTGSIDLSTDHLETKKEIETIRERFGKDNWLHSHAATCVQDVLGLKSAVPSPVKDNKGSSSSSNVSIVKAEVHKTEENTYNSKAENISTPDVHHNSEISTNGIAIKTPDSEKSDEEVNEEPAKEESIKESSPESVGMESPEEEEDEGDEELYLVQRLRPGMRKSDEYFLIVNDSWLREREVLCGKTLEKWSMETLQSCVRTGGDAPNALVQLTFDTIRPHRQERLYLMDEKDAQKLVRFLTEILESRPLNQLAYRCMKCSTQFSQEVPLSGVMKSVLTCPTCNSTLVIQMDEVPLPSHQDVKSEKLQVPVENAPATTMNSSPSQSSIGHSGLGAVSDTGVATVTGGGDRLQVKAMVNYSEVQEPPSCSAASLDPYADSPNNTGNAVKRWDSDIEIISNPSQSSIEVLDEQTRLQGSSTPARKRSSEEKQIVTVVVPTPQPPVAEANNHALSLAGLTESSSSGSFTDSICTTYEIHSSSLPKQGAMFPRVEEVDAANDVKDSLDKNINGGIDSKPDKMVNKISENTELEDDSPNSLFKMNEKAINPQANYAILLEGLLQNVGSKLAPKTPDKLLEAQENKEKGLRSDLVKYSYTDYSVVDHRVKLYLYLEIFQQKSEELVFLVRAHVVYRTLNSSYPGHLVVSTKNVYILQVTGEEGEDPASWLQKVECIPVEKMKEIYPLLWHQGIGIEMMSKGEEICNIFLVLQDQDYTGNFFTFLSGLSLPKQCNVRYKVKDEYLLSNLLTCSLSGDDVDMNVISCTIVSSCIVQRNEDCQHLSMAALVVTSTDFVLTDNLEWLFTKPSNAKKASHVQRMSNLIEVGMEGFCEIVFSFLDEVAGTDESWTLNFKTVSSLQSVVSAIKTPWEQLFSVPLTIINKET